LSSMMRLVGINKGVRIPLVEDRIAPYQFDYIHGNSMDLDGDGGLVVSTRDMNTVFKIEAPSGKIVWRMGGHGAKRSEFRIVGDPLGGFARQHSARFLDNGNLLLFDNGGFATPL